MASVTSSGRKKGGHVRPVFRIEDDDEADDNIKGRGHEDGRGGRSDYDFDDLGDSDRAEDEDGGETRPCDIGGGGSLAATAPAAMTTGPGSLGDEHHRRDDCHAAEQKQRLLSLEETAGRAVGTVGCCGAFFMVCCCLPCGDGCWDAFRDTYNHYAVCGLWCPIAVLVPFV